MRTLQFFIYSVVLVFAMQTVAVAQTANMSELFKKHLNETVQDVKQADNAIEKREILNESFTKMITAIERIETQVNLSEDELMQLNSFKGEIADKQNELNGLDGFDEVQDEDLNDFSEYSQQSLEQANRTIVISGGTLLVILLILLLVL